MTKGYQKIKSNRQQEVEKKKLQVLQNEPDRTRESLSSTSSSTTTVSSDYTFGLDEEEETLINIFDTLYDTSNESIEEEEVTKEQESVQKVSSESKTNFFENFTQLPNLADISEDISIATVIMEKVNSLEDKSKDLGHFVDPLTGLDLQNRLDTSSTDLNDNTRDIEEEEQSVSEKTECELSDIVIPDDGYFQEVQRISYDMAEEQTKDLLETFLELDRTTAAAPVEEVDWESMQKQQEAKFLQQQTLDFLEDLIHKVVERAEFLSPETILRRNLDKSKLMQELSNVLHQYNVEVNVSSLLNRKVVEYFKRKKVYRPIVQETVKNLLLEKGNYMKSLNHLDESLAKENNFRDSSSMAVTNLREELKAKEQRIADEVQIFENMVRKYLYGEDEIPSNNVSKNLYLFLRFSGLNYH